MAKQESWDFDRADGLKNLKYYLDGVFDRICSQDKFIYDEQREAVVFHTGLYHRSGYDICAQFSKNLPGSKLPWRFERFSVGRLDARFVGIPLPPTFFDGRTSPWFEPEREVLPVESSLIFENLERLPREFLRRNSDAHEMSLIEQMNLDAVRMDGCYARLRESYTGNSAALTLMAQAIGRSVGYAMHRAKRDYAYVVVGYLPESDRVVWMLPLVLQGSSAPDVVVAYALDVNGKYTPAALLSVQDAYLAARFVRRLEGFWLTVQNGAVGSNENVSEQEKEK